MSELKRLEGFTNEYINLVNKYKIKITTCCCLRLAGIESPYVFEDLGDDGGDSAYIGKVKFKFKNGEWVKNE